MAIKTIEYTVDITGVTPATEQFGGTQGDHKVTTLEFVLADKLYATVTGESETGKIMYRFDVYDGEGGIWSSVPAEITENSVNLTLEEKHTRFGGKITVYLVLTVLSEDGATETELYSFPAVLRFNNKPDGTYQEGESYESISSLAESAKNSAHAAETSNKGVQKLVAQVEEKLQNGEFDGVGIASAKIIDNELVFNYTNGAMQNLGNVKGEQGPQGEKGDTPDVSGFVEKAEGNTHTDQVYGLDSLGGTKTFIVEDNAKFEVGFDYGAIPQRQGNGNLMTNTPVKDIDCANKKYVDDLIGDIETLLGGI